MRSIMRKSSFFYVTHFMTYSWMPLYLVLANKRVNIVFVTLMAFLWLPSSVLWSERSESYAFLRMLPVSDRDIVRAKLGLGLGAVLAYWGWLSLLTMISWGFSADFFARFSLINLASSAWPPLMAFCYLGVWRFGARAMTVPILGFMGISFFSIIGFDVKNGDFDLGLTAAPWPMQVLPPAAGLAIFFLLARLGPRVMRRNDEHLQLP